MPPARHRCPRSRSRSPHFQEALDRLSVGMLLAARAVATPRERGAEATEGTLPPEAEALCFHLRRAAETLRGAQSACEASRMWTRRVLEIETETPEPSSRRATQ